MLKTSLSCKLATSRFLSISQFGRICGFLWEAVQDSKTSELVLNIELAGVANTCLKPPHYSCWVTCCVYLKYFKDVASYSSEKHSGRVIATLLLRGQQEQSAGTGEGGTQDA